MATAMASDPKAIAKGNLSIVCRNATDARRKWFAGVATSVDLSPARLHDLF